MTNLRFINSHVGRWVFPVLVLAAGFTRHGGGLLHQVLGYGAFIVALSRTIEGFVGIPAARFSTILRGACAIPANLLAQMRSRKRFSGASVLLRGVILSVILAAMFFTAITGIFLTTDRLWSSNWIIVVHAFTAFLLFVAAAIYGSIYFLARPRKDDF